ncbi:nuclear autoantigen Sp-100-like [Arvicola amphibius]|uniref:nuclear autoantigen Sp-100-like n=1 Tax=Arvicola amphibius TaxID=1047088 RepID=UPI001C08B040|nr:nuclear autoantigen Sp-100-like [Arvicola amphibius]
MSTEDEDTEKIPFKPVFLSFKRHKVRISHAIDKPFPFLEVLRDSDLITEKMYEDFKDSCTNKVPVQHVVYRALEELEKKFNLNVLLVLISLRNLSVYADLEPILEDFKNVLLQNKMWSEETNRRDLNSQLHLEQGPGNSCSRESLTSSPTGPSSSNGWRSNDEENTTLTQGNQTENHQFPISQIHNAVVLSEDLNETVRTNHLRRDTTGNDIDDLQRPQAAIQPGPGSEPEESCELEVQLSDRDAGLEPHIPLPCSNESNYCFPSLLFVFEETPYCFFLMAIGTYTPLTHTRFHFSTTPTLPLVFLLVFLVMAFLTGVRGGCEVALNAADPSLSSRAHLVTGEKPLPQIFSNCHPLCGSHVLRAELPSHGIKIRPCSVNLVNIKQENSSVSLSGEHQIHTRTDHNQASETLPKIILMMKTAAQRNPPQPPASQVRLILTARAPGKDKGQVSHTLLIQAAGLPNPYPSSPSQAGRTIPPQLPFNFARLSLPTYSYRLLFAWMKGSWGAAEAWHFERPGEVTGLRDPRQNNVDFSRSELPVTCGNAKGTLYVEKFERGTHVKSIQSETGEWFTLREFEIRGDHEKSKNWKKSIQCYGWTLGNLIEVFWGQIASMFPGWPFPVLSCISDGLFLCRSHKKAKNFVHRVSTKLHLKPWRNTRRMLDTQQSLPWVQGNIYANQKGTNSPLKQPALCTVTQQPVRLAVVGEPSPGQWGSLLCLGTNVITICKNRQQNPL